MRTSRRVAPHVEGIESRVLLSTVAPSVAAPPVVAPTIYPPPLLVTGQARGLALVRTGVPDVGNQYLLQGIGAVSPMGRVFVDASIQTSSFTGEPIGQVTITNALGSVELAITGRTPGSSGGSETFQFVVKTATGPYANLEGTGGVLELTIHPAGTDGWATFAMAINPIIIMSD